jgi:plasmid stabilization system protein ParE
MADYEVLWSGPAIADLVRIRDHIAAEGRPMAARRLARRIRDGVDVLADHPRLGRTVPEFEGAGYREVIVATYRIVYELSGQRVVILRVWHSRRDLTRLER